MCGGVKYRHGDRTVTTYFPNPGAALPVLRRDGKHELLPWGRREEHDRRDAGGRATPGAVAEEGVLPPGGWARLDSIKSGKWERYEPVPVRLDVESFMEKDRAGTSHWYRLETGQWIQGLIATRGEEQRVYVVTIVPTEETQRAIHNRWPRIVTQARTPETSRPGEFA
jgi:hypothetical protein